MNSNTDQLSRRRFLKRTAAAGAAVATVAPFSKVLGANEDLRVAVVGFRSRGNSHINGFMNQKGCRLVALCDTDRGVLEGRARDLDAKGVKVSTTDDYRTLLERDDIDIISIATPNHTHALISVEAIQAGKDVYVEKPVSHNVWEGRKIVEAARKYNRIVQTGTQSRSNPGMRAAIEFLHSGALGKIQVARGLCYKRRKSIGKVDGAQKVDPNMNYDLWCGPAPKAPLMREKLHYDWHWDFMTGNGDLGNQGIHQMDIARWALGETKLAPRVFSLGGRVGYIDDGNTPNTQIVFQDYASAPLIFEVRGLGPWKGNDNRPTYRGASVGVVVDCEDGYMVLPTYDSGIAYDRSGKEIKRFRGGADHFVNFVEAVRSRKVSDLTADIEEGHISSALCHTGNISYLVGERASHREMYEAIQGDPMGTEAFGRMMEHLEVNDVNLDQTPMKLGAILEMDPNTERFTNHEAANQLLTRNYRAPFVIPEKV